MQAVCASMITKNDKYVSEGLAESAQSARRVIDNSLLIKLTWHLVSFLTLLVCGIGARSLVGVALAISLVMGLPQFEF